MEPENVFIEINNLNKKQATMICINIHLDWIPKGFVENISKQLHQSPSINRDFLKILAGMSCHLGCSFGAII